MGFWGDVGGFFNKIISPPGEQQNREALNNQVGAAGNFANQAQMGYNQLGQESASARQMLADQAAGKNSLSAEQLRQGLQQNLAAQRSMAASAGPANAAMAARTAATQAGRLGAGMSGQAAMAGIQERNQAAQLLNDQIARQRQMEMEAATQSRGQALQGIGTTFQHPQKSLIEKIGPAIGGAATLAFSDRRLKKNIRDADEDANKATSALKSYVYKYKSENFGKGKQLGVMAQDLERAGLGHAVIDTPSGKALHSGKLAGANTAMIAALGRRVAELEGKGK